MSSATTFDDVWKLFQETDRILREQSAETEKKFREQNAKTEKTFRELRTETEREFQETNRVLQETKRVVKDVSRQIGDLGGKWGLFVENMVAPGCETLFVERGIPVHQVHQHVRVKRDDGKMAMEIDVLVVNSGSVVLVEVKSTLTVEDIRHHLQRLEQFKTFFPHYDDYQVMGAVAGIVTTTGAEQFAHSQGLFVIMQSGENLTLANDPEFKPRTW